MTTIRLFLAAALCWPLAVCAHAATVVDLGEDPQPETPALLAPAGSPYYLTNSAAEAADADVKTLWVGSGASAHIGYGRDAVADADIAVTVTRDMRVEGELNLGKAASDGLAGRPDDATAKALSLAVGQDLTIAGGRMNVAAGQSGEGGVAITAGGMTRIDDGALILRGTDDETQATLSTHGIRVGQGGVMQVHQYAVVETTGAATVVGSGGRLDLNGGVKPPTDPDAPSTEEWTFSGLNVEAGGTGILVERGGVLAAGTRGGAIQGAAWADPEAPTETDQRLIIDRGGTLDASRGTVQVLGMGGVDIAGSYIAGYGPSGITLLDAEESRVSIQAGAELGMGRALQRHLNNLRYTDIDNAGILRGGSVVLEDGAPRTMHNGMGTYTLATGALDDSETEVLYVESVRNAVRADDSAGDRGQFHGNMRGMWRGMAKDQADLIYSLSVLEAPTVTASGRAGLLNKEILEAFVDGRGRAVGAGGMVDDGVYELYSGGAQFGTNAVAYGAASEVMAGLHRRVDFARDEMARREGVTGALGWGSFHIPEDYSRRLWVGGFGRREEADPDSGIRGYKYKPSGFMAGYDRLLGDALVVGGALAYGAGDYEDKAAQANSSEITSYSVGGYVGYRRWTGFTASAYGSYSYLDNDLSDRRGNMRRTAEHSSYAWTLGGKLGYELCPAENLRLTPTIGLERIHAESKSHTERLDGLGVMRVGAVSRRSTLVPLDVGMSFDLMRREEARLRLNAALGYAYDLESDGMDGSLVYSGLHGANAINTARRELGRHRFSFGAGLQFSGSKLDFDARYDYHTRDNYKSHHVQGNLGVKF